MLLALQALHLEEACVSKAPAGKTVGAVGDDAHEDFIFEEKAIRVLLEGDKSLDGAVVSGPGVPALLTLEVEVHFLHPLHYLVVGAVHAAIVVPCIDSCEVLQGCPSYLYPVQLLTAVHSRQKGFRQGPVHIVLDLGDRRVVLVVGVLSQVPCAPLHLLGPERLLKPVCDLHNVPFLHHFVVVKVYLLLIIHLVQLLVSHALPHEDHVVRENTPPAPALVGGVPVI
mmetsp:Transcript_13121/g.22161  ORF Transcript_13121/g.22161 Transcript_13121/m.22161 type:complete len:226 (-) Transcript_13121:389-1066(-)